MKNIIKYNGRTFKYNEEKALLQLMYENQTIDAMGLSRENWKEDPKYWVDIYNELINEELFYLI